MDGYHADITNMILAKTHVLTLVDVGAGVIAIVSILIFGNTLIYKYIIILNKKFIQSGYIASILHNLLKFNNIRQ